MREQRHVCTCDYPSQLLHVAVCHFSLGRRGGRLSGSRGARGRDRQDWHPREGVHHQRHGIARPMYLSARLSLGQTPLLPSGPLHNLENTPELVAIACVDQHALDRGAVPISQHHGQWHSVHRPGSQPIFLCHELWLSITRCGQAVHGVRIHNGCLHFGFSSISLITTFRA